MSVAFRREGDDEHLEPKFELPIPPGPNLVTARGLALIEARLAELEVLAHGLADEAEIKATRRQWRYWSTRAATAQVMPVPSGERVEFGCQVRLALNGKPREIHIVGDDEAEPAAGRLAFSAPLVRAMMGAEIGELLPFGGKEDALEILAIRAFPSQVEAPEDSEPL